MQPPVKYVVVVKDPNAVPPPQQIQYIQQPQPVYQTQTIQPWSCPKCTFSNTQSLTNCQMCNAQNNNIVIQHQPVQQQVVYNPDPAPPYQPQPAPSYQQQQQQNQGSSPPTFEGHKFIQLNKAKEDELENVKWTLNFRAVFIATIIGLIFWCYLLINSTIKHYERERSLQFGFCDGSVDGYYNCLDDNVEFECQDLADCISEGYDCWYQNQCAPYNGQSHAIFIVRVIMIPILLLYCWKCFKNVWKGVPLPKTEKSHKKTGCCKKILKLPGIVSGKLYEMRINLRAILDKMMANNKNSSDVAHGDNSEHGQFVYWLWTACLILTIAEFLVMDLPFQILNISSEDANLQFIAWVSIPLDIFVMLLLIFMRNCCNAHSMRCSNDLDYYPEKNLKFIMCVAGRLSVGSLTAFNGLFSMVMATNATPQNVFTVWLIALNFFKGLIAVIKYKARFFSLIFIFHNYWQKESVSLRESLLIKDALKNLFVWSIFKVEIKDEDKFCYVDKNRATAEVIRLDNRTAFGKAYYPWTLLFIGAILWGSLLAVSLTFGE